eukprot:CAMPEP_0201516946 /NCGR_PEP_ID=MMETSP0161_2-20130828/8184_1 /ASSEMBLY_ACC=CAM_ASM_000251 /TAXON_ID=180227 /ORGANISM="Neoparamoeba aestuarina, Strain SoJaBio B1-5/56/2" /LENGTH=47 /DNA_ID= /DNA_START= /DNA_END= /DNA_ORIENTATION=
MADNARPSTDIVDTSAGWKPAEMHGIERVISDESEHTVVLHLKPFGE